MNGHSQLEIPLKFDPSEFPLITVGAWVKITSIDDRLTDPRFYFYILRNFSFLTLIASCNLKLKQKQISIFT
jgi:hypothetical protein